MKIECILHVGFGFTFEFWMKNWMYFKGNHINEKLVLPTNPVFGSYPLVCCTMFDI